MRSTRTTGLLLTAATAIGLLAAPATAGAAVTCSYNAGPNLTIERSSPDDGIVIGRSGSNITIAEGDLDSNTPVTCAPNPNPDVNTVDNISYQDTQNAPDALAITLSGGPLAPGGNEAGDDEIEINFDAGTGANTLVIEGGAGADSIELGTDGTIPVINPNATNGEVMPDADWALVGTFEASAVLGAGNDSFDGSPTEGGAFAEGWQSGMNVVGGSGNDSISGGPDNHPDLFRAGPGNDLLFGQNGNDTLFGDGGEDVLQAGGGNDRLSGGGSDDTLAGNAGRDTLDGGPDADSMNGGPGTDTVTYRNVNYDVRVKLDPLANDGGAGDNRRDRVGPAVEVVIGSNRGDDILTGSPRNDTLIGLGGADRLIGLAGIDKLVARDGRADLRIDCGPGADGRESARIDRGRDPAPISC